MKKTILLFGVFLASFAFAQVSISPVSTDTPQATLDIKAMEVATQPDGILIPRLARTKAEGMGGTIEESTMIYVNKLDGTAGTKTADVDTKGFYYYNGTKWVKVGGESAKSIRSVAHITTAEWANNQYALIQTGPDAIQLPPANVNNGRIISLSNDTASPINYASPAPARNSVLLPGKGQVLMSDGTKWYVIGGI